MTSANKKFGYYDFKHSYQYPMSNATPMEITSNSEKKGEEKARSFSERCESTPIWDPKKYVPPHLSKRKVVPKEKWLFPSIHKDNEKEAKRDPDSM